MIVSFPTPVLEKRRKEDSRICYDQLVFDVPMRYFKRAGILIYNGRHGLNTEVWK